jgi:hypothetical protein
MSNLYQSHIELAQNSLFCQNSRAKQNIAGQRKKTELMHSVTNVI